MKLCVSVGIQPRQGNSSKHYPFQTSCKQTTMASFLKGNFSLERKHPNFEERASFIKKRGG